ncbi:hypothetical protein Tco_0563371 [Tanacetum coccineum]
MLEFEAFKTYRAYTTGEKDSKSKATNKKTGSESSPKTKPSQASISGSGDGVDILSKVPDEQQQTGSGTNEGAGDKPEVPDVPEYRLESKEESWTFSQGEDQESTNYSHDESDDEGDDFVHPNLSTYKADEEEEEKEDDKSEDDDEVASDQKILTPPEFELTEEDVNQDDDDTMGRDPEMKKMGTVRRLDLNLVSSLGIELSELKQTNQFAKVVSSILGIVDKYLASNVKDTVDVAVQLKSNKLRDEAQAENQDFLNSLDSNMKRIIKEQFKDQTSKIMIKVKKTRVKKILMNKMEENNSIDRSDVQKNLYRALLKEYNSDKDLLSSYGEVVTLKRGRDAQDKDEEPSAGLNHRSKQQRSGKEESSKKGLCLLCNTTRASYVQ